MAIIGVCVLTVTVVLAVSQGPSAQQSLSAFLEKSDTRMKMENIQAVLGLQHKALNFELVNISAEVALFNLADTAARITSTNLTRCATVTLSLSNLAYADAFNNWYTMVGAECSAIIALDAKTCVYLAARKELRSWCMVSPPSLTAKFQSNHALFDPDFQQNYLVGTAKLIFPAILVLCGKSVIVSEMDVFWQTRNVVGDLLSAENAVYDVQMSSHVVYSYQQQVFALGRGEVNIGFFFIRHSLRTTIMFKELLLYAIYHSTELGFYRTYDQKLYDRFVRHPLPAEDDRHEWDHRFLDFPRFAAAAEWHNGSTGIPWRRLPLTYTTNIGRRGSKLRFDNRTATVHISFGIKEPSHRLYCAYRLGLISPNSSYSPPSSLTPAQQFCFELFDANGTFLRRVY